MSERRWRTISASEITVGDIVSVRGISSRNSAIVHVSKVDRTHEREVLVVEGRQPWGEGWRHILRRVHPEATAERLVEDET